MEAAAKAYVESTSYEPGIFAGIRRTYRVTQRIAFDPFGELLQSDGTELFR